MDYWRCVDNTSFGRTCYDLDPLFTYEHEVVVKPSSLSYTYRDPAPFTLTMEGDGRGALVMTWFWVTLWLPLLVFSVYPVIAFIRGPLRRWRRRRRGLCIKCGYDLTGNVSGVCPECGTKT